MSPLKDKKAHTPIHKTTENVRNSSISLALEEQKKKDFIDGGKREFENQLRESIERLNHLDSDSDEG